MTFTSAHSEVCRGVVCVCVFMLVFIDFVVLVERQGGARYSGKERRAGKTKGRLILGGYETGWQT